MKTTMKIMSIGDIHGRNTWKTVLFGSLMDYNSWRTEVDNGAKEAFEDTYPIFNEMDKIVFVGDYVDSFDVQNLEMKLNLEEIIHLKSEYPDKVVLLLGNHDIQYIVADQICSGYRPEMKFDFQELFTKNIDKFTFAYYHEREIDGRLKRTLWTHAGVTHGWLRQLHATVKRDGFRFKADFEGDWNLRPDEIINKAWQYRLNILFNVDGDSGGYSEFAGPVWIRPRRLRWDALEGYDQVIGHTPHHKVTEYDTEPTAGRWPEVKDTIFCVDCLEHGDGTVLIKEY
jgi:predicted phosphodiesterase